MACDLQKQAADNAAQALEVAGGDRDEKVLAAQEAQSTTELAAQAYLDAAAAYAQCISTGGSSPARR